MSDRDVVQFECPRCLSNVRAGKRDVGNFVECGECGQSLQVPQNSSTGPSAFDDLFGDSPQDTTTNERQTEYPTADGVEQLTPLESSGSSTAVELDGPLSDGDARVPLDSDSQSDSGGSTDASQLDKGSGLVLGPDDLLPLEPEPLEIGFVSDNEVPDPLAGEDPFKETEDLTPLKVDGITSDGINVDELRGIKCEICDTRIHVNESQTSGHVQCPVCFSEVEIQPEKPLTQRDREWRKQVLAPEPDTTAENEPSSSRSESGPDESYDLAPLDDEVLRPSGDMLFPDGAPDQFQEIANSSMEITEDDLIEDELSEDTEPSFDPDFDYDDVGKLAEQHHAQESFDVIDEDSNPIGLVPSDLGVPHTEETRARRPKKSKPRTRPPSTESLPENKPSVGSSSTKQPSRRDRLKQANEQREDSAEVSSIDDDVSEAMDMTPFTFANLAERIRVSLTSPSFLWRAAITVALLGTACCFYVFAAAITEKAKVEEITMSMKVTRFMFTSVYSLLWILGSLFLWYVASMLFRDNALGKTKVTSWKHHGFSDIQSTALLFAFSFFLAGLPMLMFGPSIANPFRLLLATPMLLSAWFNRSPFMVIAIDAFKPRGNPLEEWLVFGGTVFALFLICLVGGLLYLFPFSFVAVLATGIQVFAICGYAVISGWHVGRIVCRLQSESE